jgi:predicted nucleotidyltransferase
VPLGFDRVIRSLKDHGVDFVIIGANAAIAHGAPVGTIDLDLCYRRTKANVARLVKALQSFHPRLRGISDTVPFDFTADAVGRGCNFTFVTDVGDLDILGHITGLGGFDPISARAVPLRMFGCEVLVMALEDVIKSKKAAGRVKDKAQLPVLEETLRQRKGPTGR